MNDDKTDFWLDIGRVTLGKKKLTIFAFKQMFKLPPNLVQGLFALIRNSFPFVRPKHLLWTLFYLKTTAVGEDVIAITLLTNKKTLQQYVLETLTCLDRSLPDFDFESRFKNWPHLRPSCLVDSTFVPIRRPYLQPYYYYNVAHKGHGFLYQVTASLGQPYRILHFAGPYRGSCSDGSIIRTTVIPLLREGEKVMCDKGYLNESRCMTPPEGKFGALSHEQRSQYIEVARVRQLNERVIGRIMEWGIMVKKWNLTSRLHELCARCVAKLAQLQLYTNPLT